MNAIQTEVKKLAYQKSCVCDTTLDASCGVSVFNDMCYSVQFARISEYYIFTGIIITVII
jgi:hypothetical protein